MLLKNYIKSCISTMNWKINISQDEHLSRGGEREGKKDDVSVCKLST